MKITFISSSLTNHQVPFSAAMRRLIGEDYKFISTVPMSEESKVMKGVSYDATSYEIRAYESNESFKKAKRLATESDVVILGSAPDDYIKGRLKMSKLTFKYSERLYKEGLSVKKFPRAAVSAYLHHSRYQKYPIYMLCASAYTVADLALFGNYKKRTFKWGYFPETKTYDIEQLMESKRRNFVKVLWVGRFVGWKHPEQALVVAQRLDKENLDFKLKIIGNGEEFESIKNTAGNIGLKHPVEFLGAMTPDEVRRHMEEANIFFFTSDFNEGWGAVLNESMNSGCAVVASHAIGSVPFLLKHGENGFIYKNGEIEDLCKKVILLAKDIALCEKLGKNAYFTIKNTWSAEIAANRFVKLSENLLRENVCEYEDGPCSRAPLIKNNWFNEGQKQ